MEAKKGYLKDNKISASQLATWIKSPKEYIKQYINGEPFVGNKYTEFGTKIHKLIETDDPLTENIPKLKYRELYFEKEWNNVILNGYIDSYEIGEIIDYKVSKKGKWNPKIVKEHEQLKFYGLWHFLEHGTLPLVSILHIESDEVSSRMCLTGEATQYNLQVKQEDIEYIISKINEFTEWCEQYKNDNR